MKTIIPKKILENCHKNTAYLIKVMIDDLLIILISGLSHAGLISGLIHTLFRSILNKDLWQ